MKIEDRLDYLYVQLQRIHDKLELHEWMKLYYPWNCSLHRKNKNHVGRCNCKGVYNLKCACGKERLNVSSKVFDSAAEDFTESY